MKSKVLKESLFPKINTLRFRISILYVTVIGLILLLLQGVLYFNDVNSTSKEFDVQLQMKAEQIGGAVNTFRSMLGNQSHALDLAAQQALDLSIEYPQYIFMPESPEKFWLANAKKLGLDQDFLVIMDAQGNIITKSKNVSGSLLLYFKKIGKLNSNKNMYYKINLKNSDLRVVVEPYYYAYRQMFLIAVGSSYEAVDRLLWQHLLFILSSIFIYLIIASLIVRLFVIRVLSSVMEISKVARTITQENLNARIKLIHTDEEIKHLTGSLNEMIARLEKSFSLVKEFSLEMAHEVKTPLAIISGQSQLALQNNHTPDEYKEMFRVVLKEAKRSQRFVSDLLLLTKLDSRLIKLRFDAIDLNEFIHEICKEMQVIAGPQGIVVQEDIPQEVMLIKGDKTHLKRVFLNLIDNALKFTPPGGMIRVIMRRNGQKAVVLISDNGPGIAPDDLSRIFNKFYRVIKNGKENTSGCGLGLGIVYSIIEFHQGSVTVDSELEKGTTFKVEFPLDQGRPL